LAKGSEEGCQRRAGQGQGLAEAVAAHERSGSFRSPRMARILRIAFRAFHEPSNVRPNAGRHADVLALDDLDGSAMQPFDVAQVSLQDSCRGSGRRVFVYAAGGKSASGTDQADRRETTMHRANQLDKLDVRVGREHIPHFGGCDESGREACAG